jgi:hypothetical protein
VRFAVRRAMLFALFGLLASSGSVLAQGRLAPWPGPWVVRPRPIPPLVARPLVPVVVPPVGVPWFGVPMFPFWNVTTWPYPVWNFNPWPTYVYVGDSVSSHPQLVFNDGTTYIVRDYWRVGDQLHFVTVEEGGTKSVEHTVPFTDLDVQRTTDAVTARGFRFVLRDEPIEQWLRDHPPIPAQR